MLKALRKADDLLNAVFVYLSVALLVIIIISTSTQVFTRYILNASLSGTDEVARFAFIWMSMMGASICVRNHGHAVVSILNDALKSKPCAQKTHEILIQLLIIIGSLVLLIYGIQLVGMTGTQKSAGLGIPMSYTYACIPFGALGMIVNGIVNIVDTIAVMKGGADK